MKEQTVKGAAEEIIALAPHLAVQRLQIQAIIKRLIHSEKLSVYQRFKRNFDRELGRSGVDYLDHKIETHEEMSQMSDSDVITWPVE